MENQALVTVKAFVTAVQQLDMAQLGTLLHPKVKWDQAGNNRFAGVKQSVEEVFQMVGGMFQVSENTLQLKELKVIGVNGNSVACVLRYTASRPGATLDVDNLDVYTVVDGQIVEAKVHTSDQAHEDAFWGQE